MAFWIALLAAVSFAFGSVLQQKGALQTPAAEGDPRFLAQVIRQPVWLLGGLCQVGGWVLQAVALVSGITLFVAVGQPSGGIDEPGAAAWWSAILVSAAAMTILGLSGTRLSVRRRRRGSRARRGLGSRRTRRGVHPNWATHPAQECGMI